MKIPSNAKREGALIRWWQPTHRGELTDDWLIDGIRINGEEINPKQLSLNFTSGFEYLDVITADNMEVGTYCGKEGVAIGKTTSEEPSTLTSRDVQVEKGHVLQFSINVGCGKNWDASLQPVSILRYKNDNNMTHILHISFRTHKLKIITFLF